MNNLKLDDYLEIINKEKIRKGLEEYTPLYPMLRKADDKLYIGVLLTKNNANVWDKDSNIKPEYWVLIDPSNNQIVEFNETNTNDFVIGKLIPKDIENKQKEISKYAVEKTMQYKEYLMNDIKNDELPIQKKLSTILNNEITIDGEKVNINDYLIANIEQDIVDKVKELVDLLVASKYNSITFYYDALFNDIITKYKNNKEIDKEKMALCVEIMNNYYDGVIAIDNFFNIN